MTYYQIKLLLLYVPLPKSRSLRPALYVPPPTSRSLRPAPYVPLPTSLIPTSCSLRPFPFILLPYSFSLPFVRLPMFGSAVLYCEPLLCTMSYILCSTSYLPPQNWVVLINNSFG